MAAEKTIEQLRELYKKDFTPDYSENPYLVEFNKRLNDIDKKSVAEFAKIISLFKSWFIEQSMQIFPMTVDEINYRNGVVIELGKLIKTLEQYSVEKPDPVFRDTGKLKSELNQANSKILS